MRTRWVNVPLERPHSNPTHLHLSVVGAYTCTTNEKGDYMDPAPAIPTGPLRMRNAWGENRLIYQH